MFRSQWHRKPPQASQKPMRPFNQVVANGSASVRDQDGGGGNDGTVSSLVDQQQQAAIDNIEEHTRDVIRDNQVEKRDKQQAFYKRKVILDQKRRQLAEGNIIQFELNSKSKHLDKKSELNKMLLAAGFKFDNVLALKMNDFTNSKIEVQFNDDVKIDCDALEAKLFKKGYTVSVSKYDLSEEVIDIFGLPLTSNMEQLKDDIKHAIFPFVKKIVGIKAMTYVGERSEKDFFHGHFNGNYRVTVVPCADRQVPMYLVIGKEKAMAKADYHRKSSDKIAMCNDCFSTDHLNFDPMCQGVKPWDDYIQEFMEKWQTAVDSHDDTAAFSAEQLLNREEAARVAEFNRINEKNFELQEKVASLTSKTQTQNAEKEDLMAKMSDLESRCERLQKQMETSQLFSEADMSGASVFVEEDGIENDKDDDEVSKKVTDPLVETVSSTSKRTHTPSPADASKKPRALVGLPQVDDWISFTNENGNKQNARVDNIGEKMISLQVKTSRGLKNIEHDLEGFDFDYANGPFWKVKN